MRVLMTGFAARGVGSTRTRYKIASLPDMLARALREEGHEVDGPRRVPLGEPVRLDLHDVALVQVGWVSSLSSSYAHEAARVMACMSPRVLRYCDGFAQGLADDLHSHVLSDAGWAKVVGNFRRHEYAGWAPADLERARQQLLVPLLDSESVLVVPLMGWGDPSRFDASTRARLRARLVPLDPQSLLCPAPTTWAPDPRRLRRWVCATLPRHDRWLASQDFTWDVLRLGGRLKMPGGTNVPGGGGVVVPESRVLDEYARSWGVLSPPYASAGSGYWRTRFEQSASAGCVLWPGNVDAARIGSPFPESAPFLVEHLGTASLAELSRAQAETLDRYKWPRERAVRVLQELLREAAGS